MASDAHIRTCCTNPECEREYRVKADLIGQKATCKACETKFIIMPAVESTAPLPQPGEQAGSNQARVVKRVLTIAFSSVGIVLVGLVIWVYATTRPEAQPEHPTAYDSKTAATEKQPTPRHPQQQPAGRSSADIVAQVEQSVALIHDGSRCGTGFMIERTVMVTNAHVVRSMFLEDTTVYFPTAGEETYRILRILHFDEPRDLCLLEIEGRHEPIRLADSSDLRRGEDIIILGNPAVGSELILKNAVTKGLFSSAAIVEGQKFLQISASINPGNSGGPIVNPNGEVIAVATLKAIQQEGIAFGIPASDVTDALLEVKRRSDRQLAELNDLCVAKTTVRHLSVYASVNRAVMEEYTQAMDLSIQSGEAASDGLQKAQAELQPLLTEYEEQLRLKIMEANLRRLQKSEHIDSETRKNLLDLWGCAQQIQSYVENPRGNYNSYREKSHKLRDELERLMNILEIQLDVDLD